MNWIEAERAFKHAIELNPGYATAHQSYGRSLGYVGRFEAALGELQRAKELDPLSSLISAFIGQVHLFARQYDRAVEQLRLALEIHLDHVLLHHNLGEAYLAQGRWNEAVASLERSVEGPGQHSSHYLAMLGCAYARANRKADAVKILNELQRRLTLDLVSEFDMASLHAALGEKERALAWLEQGYQRKDDWLAGLRAWPWFDSLRSEPRFMDLLRRMNLPWWGPA